MSLINFYVWVSIILFILLEIWSLWLFIPFLRKTKNETMSPFIANPFVLFVLSFLWFPILFVFVSVYFFVKSMDKIEKEI